MREIFSWLARRTASAVGSPWAFAVALLAGLGWLALGPSLGAANPWRTVLDAGATLTLLLTFLGQNARSRDSRAVQLKLDELLRAVQEARTDLVDLERRPEAELGRLEREFEALGSPARATRGTPAAPHRRAPRPASR